MLRNGKCVERRIGGRSQSINVVRYSRCACGWPRQPLVYRLTPKNGWEQAVATGNMTTKSRLNDRINKNRHGQFPDLQFTMSVVPGSNIDVEPASLINATTTANHPVLSSTVVDTSANHTITRLWGAKIIYATPTLFATNAEYWSHLGDEVSSITVLVEMPRNWECQAFHWWLEPLSLWSVAAGGWEVTLVVGKVGKVGIASRAAPI